MVTRPQGSFPTDVILKVIDELKHLDSHKVRVLLHRDAEVTELSSVEMGRIIQTNQLPAFGEGVFELRLQVVPSDEANCGFTLAFGRSDTYDVHIGHGLHMDEIRNSDVPPVGVLEAILSGRVVKTIWTIGSSVVQAKGTVTLKNDQSLHDKSLGLLAFLARKTEISYQPYPRGSNK